MIKFLTISLNISLLVSMLIFFDLNTFYTTIISLIFINQLSMQFQINSIREALAIEEESKVNSVNHR